MRHNELYDGNESYQDYEDYDDSSSSTSSTSSEHETNLTVMYTVGMMNGFFNELNYTIQRASLWSISSGFCSIIIVLGISKLQIMGFWQGVAFGLSTGVSVFNAYIFSTDELRKHNAKKTIK